ncbi:MAG: hypothetical protein OEQ13_11170, partial [Acidobacteriota bacterium]|nr:hypothetical protein [Acidobacteriota bacterium]
MKLVRSNQVTPSAVRRVIVAAAAVLFSVTLAPALTTQARAEAGARDEAGRRTTGSARSAAAERRAERVVRGRDAERPLRSSTSRVIKARRSGGVEDVATGWPRARPLAASRVPRPRVSPALRSLAGSARSRGVPNRAGLRAGMPGETARIELAALPGRAEELLLRVDAMGGTRLASSGSVVRADVPVASIDELLTSGVVRAARLAREGARTRTRGDGKAPQPAK